MGDVLVKSWNVLTRHFQTFVLIVGLAQVPTLVASAFLIPNVTARTGFSLSAWLIFMGVLFLQLFVSALAEASVVFGAFQDLRGKTVSAQESFARGLARFLPVVVLSLLMGLAVGFGLILCLVPGVLALAAFRVALPTCVVERLGPIQSISRSVDLTRGHWWPILGVLFALFLVNLAVAAALRAALPLQPALPYTLASWIWTVITTSCGAVFTAILYHDLRAVNEGIGIEEIAAVFD